jgi:hypothetical protein
MQCPAGAVRQLNKFGFFTFTMASCILTSQ